MVENMLQKIQFTLQSIRNALRNNEEVATVLNDALKNKLTPTTVIEIITTTGHMFTNNYSDVTINKNTILLESENSTILIRLDQVVSVSVYPN